MLSSWVTASTREHIEATLQDGYGYQWWVDDSDMYLALGYAGQFIYVVPDKDLVVVFTGHLDDSDFHVPQELLTEYIIPAAKSSTPLRQNRRGIARLESRIRSLATP